MTSVMKHDQIEAQRQYLFTDSRSGTDRERLLYANDK